MFVHCSVLAALANVATDAPAEVEVFLETSSTRAPIHVQLSCDCGATRCNCLKVCDCKLPTASFLELPATSNEAPRRRRRHRGKAADGERCASWERALGSQGWDAVPTEEDASFSFLEEQATTAPGLNQPMECDCEKVKCNCLRKCECDSSASAALLQSQVQQVQHLQLDHGVGNLTASRSGGPARHGSRRGGQIAMLRPQEDGDLQGEFADEPESMQWPDGQGMPPPVDPEDSRQSEGNKAAR